MAEALLAALRRNLEVAESQGRADKVKLIKARIAKLEKNPEAESAAAPAVMLTDVKPAASAKKSAAKKPAARKRK
jgi:hypothetical protein